MSRGHNGGKMSDLFCAGRRIAFAAALCTGLSYALPAAGYEVATHTQLSFEAFARSQLFGTTSVTLERMGLAYPHNLRQENPLGERFFDVWGLEVTDRFANNPGFFPASYETKVFHDARLLGNNMALHGWVARGGFREDDYPWFGIPQDDRCDNTHSVPCFRIFHHFYDPLNDRALLTPGSLLETPIKSPTWALGTADPFATGVVADLARRNHFSIVDAREAMYRAITLTRPDGSGAYAELYPGASSQVRARAQAAYWATTLRALGSVLHHVQDMSQSQHTRNDSHGSGSFYENYVDARAQRKRLVLPDGQEAQLPALDFGSYPAVSFNTYTDFWTTARGDAPRNSSLVGRGLADYSSRGFYSASTNIGSSAGAMYPQPPRNASTLTEENLTNAVDLTQQPIQGSLRLYKGPVTDTAIGATEEARLTSSGLFDQFLLEQGSSPRFTLNHYNYEAQAALLIPRAIGYSTGLINYFFRGQLELALPDEKIFAVEDFSTNAGFSRIKVNIRNSTPTIIPSGTTDSFPQTTSAAGTLVAVLRYRINTCLQFPSLRGAPGSAEWNESCREPSQRTADSDLFPMITVSEARAAGSIDASFRTVVFNFSTPLPFNATDVDLQVVYRGPLGAEADGLAVGFKHLSEPTFFNFDNFQDCQLNSGCLTGQCPDAQNASLPWPGGISVVSVSNLTAGSYGRAAFLTLAAYRQPFETLPGYLYVATNQDFGAQVTFEVPGLPTETYPPGPMTLGELYRSRSPLMSWQSARRYGGTCSDPSCYYQWAEQNCPAINSGPVPVAVNPAFWQE